MYRCFSHSLSQSLPLSNLYIGSSKKDAFLHQSESESIATYSISLSCSPQWKPLTLRKQQMPKKNSVITWIAASNVCFWTSFTFRGGLVLGSSQFQLMTPKNKAQFKEIRSELKKWWFGFRLEPKMLLSAKAVKSKLKIAISSITKDDSKFLIHSAF